jgi:hypothetical protein
MDWPGVTAAVAAPIREAYAATFMAAQTDSCDD